MKKEDNQSDDLPEDLGLVIGTPEQSKWKTVQTNATQVIESLELQLMVNKAVLERANLELKDLKEPTPSMVA